MTNKEALESVVQVSVSDKTLEKAMIDNGINGAETYASSSSKSIDLAAIDVLNWVLATPDVSEGGYSVKYDRNAIRARVEALSAKLSIDSGSRPVIRDASNRW